MNVDGEPTRSIRALPEQRLVEVIDQTALPHEFRWVRLTRAEDAVEAIRVMRVRGAPLIGATAGYGMALAAAADPSDAALERAGSALAATRPTAVNLRWALDRMQRRLLATARPDRAAAAWAEATAIADEDVRTNEEIGRHGLAVLRGLRPPAGRPLGVLTHCNAGWLATVDRGTALAPVYLAAEKGLPVHVWVSETRPRNQGLLTAWELAQQGIPHTVLADNACGWLLARGLVDVILVGADRVAANGDVANKVGTYLKALAGRAAGVPCYVAAPCSTVDLGCPSGGQIPIEERDGDEVRMLRGRGPDGRPAQVRQLPAAAPVCNPAFDVTAAELVAGIITELGVLPPTVPGLAVAGRTGHQDRPW